MPIISMNIEKDVEQVAGLDETEYLDKGGRVEKFNQRYRRDRDKSNS